MFSCHTDTLCVIGDVRREEAKTEATNACQDDLIEHEIRGNLIGMSSLYVYGDNPNAGLCLLIEMSSQYMIFELWLVIRPI